MIRHQNVGFKAVSENIAINPFYVTHDQIIIHKKVNIKAILEFKKFTIDNEQQVQKGSGKWKSITSKLGGGAIEGRK